MARWQMRDRDEPPLTRHLKVARFALLSAYMLNSWCNLVVFDFFFQKNLIHFWSLRSVQASASAIFSCKTTLPHAIAGCCLNVSHPLGSLQPQADNLALV